MLGEKSVVNKRPYWQVVRGQQCAVNIPGVIKINLDGFERMQDWVHFTMAARARLTSSE